LIGARRPNTSPPLTVIETILPKSSAERKLTLPRPLERGFLKVLLGLLGLLVLAAGGGDIVGCGGRWSVEVGGTVPL
jgi:hypothetical protein